MNIAQAILLATILVNSILAFSSARKARRGAIYMLLFVHLLSVVFWAIFILINITLPDWTGDTTYTAGEAGYWITKLIFISATLWLSSQLWFVKLFPHEPLPQKWRSYWSVGFACLVLVICFFDNTIITQVVIQPDGYQQVQMGPFTGIYSLYALLHFTWPNIILYRKWKHTKNAILKRQLGILLTSYILFHVSSFLSNWILPVYFQIYFWNALGPAFSLILVGGMAYASTHYRFLDLRLSLQRAMTYISAVGIVIAAALYAFNQPWITRTHLLLVDTVTILVALVAFTGITKIMAPVWNLILFRRTRNYLEILREATLRISASPLGPQEAVQQMLQTIRQALGTSHCRLAFAGVSVNESSDNDFTALSSKSSLLQWSRTHKHDAAVKAEVEYSLELSPKGNSKKFLQAMQAEMEDFYVAAAIPITDNTDQLVAVLLLSDKIDRDFFSQQEIREVKFFLEQMTFYIYNVKHFLQLQQRLHGSETVHKEFMKGLFHEVRTPLTVAQSSVEALQWTLSEKEREDYIAKASSHIQKSSRILSDFADIVALEQGKVQLQRTPLPLQYIVQIAVGKVQSLIRQTGMKVTLPAEKKLQTLVVEADAERLSNAFTHIILNAILFRNTSRTSRLVVRAEQEKNMAVLTFQDNGEGIPKEDVPRVFEKFFRGDAAKNIHTGGPGLGLAYAKAVMEAHGGGTTLNSAVGIGTKVTISLPLGTGQKTKSSRRKKNRN